MEQNNLLHKSIRTCYPCHTMNTIPRYAPHRPFPPWRFLPGGPHPHPEKEGGYAHGGKPGLSAPFSREEMQTHPDYLYSLDLYNHRYCWEGHVWLEALWNQLGRRGETADFLKALIKICAAGVKEEMGAPEVARGHLARALELARDVPEFYLGLDAASIKRTLAEGTLPTTLLLREEVISLAGGCFWGVQRAMALLPGVLETTCGYQGGGPQAPSYRQVCGGDTGHAEVVRVRFAPSLLPRERLLKAFFLIHDPTQVDRQGPDVGSQYRSAIFCQNREQWEEVRRFLEQISSRHPRPLATETAVDALFYPAEECHQNYLDRTPGGYCHISTDILERIRQGHI